MISVAHDASRHRLVVAGDSDQEAELIYERDDDRLYLLHTEVPVAFRGQGTGGRLVTAALDVARLDHLTVVPWCPFARRWLREHPEAADGVAIDWSTPRQPPRE